MGIIFKKPTVSHYNNADHITFVKQSQQIFLAHASDINAPALISAFADDVVVEEDGYKWIRKSEYTEKKADMDHERDLVIKNIAGIIQISLNHFDPEIREAAKKLDILIKNYGNMTAMDYDGETAAIDSLVNRMLNPEYMYPTAQLNLMEWVNRLREMNELFKEFVDDTEAEILNKPAITQRVARINTDAAERKIIARVESLININGEGIFGLMAEQYNIIVTHYNTIVNEHYGRMHSRIDITDARIDTIPTQQYTGRPVFVIPTVTVNRPGTEAVEIIFTQDFTVAYRNNVDPGTATIIITGTGRYKGEALTTFNIE
jgi:hypothetical protein